MTIKPSQKRHHDLPPLDIFPPLSLEILLDQPDGFITPTEIMALNFWATRGKFAARSKIYKSSTVTSDSSGRTLYHTDFKSRAPDAPKTQAEPFTQSHTFEVLSPLSPSETVK